MNERSSYEWVVANMVDYNIVVSKAKLQSHY